MNDILEPRPQYLYTKLAEIRPSLKSVTCMFIVLEKDRGRQTKDGKVVYSALVADETASIRVTLWDKYGEYLQPGDIVRLIGGNVNVLHDVMSLSSGRKGRVERVGEFTMLLNESLNVGEVEWGDDTDGGRKVQRQRPGEKQ